MDEMFLPKPDKRAKLRLLLTNRERGFQRRLARYCGVDPRTVQNWLHDTWPGEVTERRLWEFFRKVDAVGVVMQSDPAVTLRDLEVLLTADPGQQVGALTMAEVQEQLRQMVKLLLGVTSPPRAAHETAALSRVKN